MIRSINIPTGISCTCFCDSLIRLSQYVGSRDSLGVCGGPAPEASLKPPDQLRSLPVSSGTLVCSLGCFVSLAYWHMPPGLECTGVLALYTWPLGVSDQLRPHLSNPPCPGGATSPSPGEAPFGRRAPVQCWAPGYLGKIPHPVPHPYIVLYKFQTG